MKIKKGQVKKGKRKWPTFNRILAGNCAFCWGSFYGPHDKKCSERKAKYYKEIDKK